MNKVVEKKWLIPFCLVTSLFLLWGLANNLTTTLLSAFKKVLDMNDTQTSLIQSAFYGAYFCFAIPAALYIKRYSYKAGILLGLGLYATGAMLFLPAAIVGTYGFFLIAIYVLAAGCTFLETVANPYIIAMGSPDTATRRLNVAQSLNPLGSITGILLSQVFVLQEISLHNISSVYLWLGLIMVLILVLMAFCLKTPAKEVTETNNSEFRIPNSELKQPPATSNLWRNPRFALGVLAEFFYIGAQVGVWSFTMLCAMQVLNCSEADSLYVYLAAIIAFTIMRFVFTWLMKWFGALTLQAISATVALLACGMVILGICYIVIIGLDLICACMCLMYPTIYATALADIPNEEDKKVGASLLIMSIVGGALLTVVQGYLSDLTNTQISFLVPALSFLVILLYSLYNRK